MKTVFSIEIVRKRRLLKRKKQGHVFYGQGRNPLQLGPLDPSICPPAWKDLFIKIKEKRKSKLDFGRGGSTLKYTV